MLYITTETTNQDIPYVYKHISLIIAIKGKERKRTCIAPIVSISTTKCSDVDHTELPAVYNPAFQQPWQQGTL